MISAFWLIPAFLVGAGVILVIGCIVGRAESRPKCHYCGRFLEAVTTMPVGVGIHRPDWACLDCDDDGEPAYYRNVSPGKGEAVEEIR